MDTKIFFLLVSFALNWSAYVPYLTGMFSGTVRPHAYTWLIWSLTVSITAAGVWYGGGGYPAFGLVVGAVFCFSVFLLSFRYGTKHITLSDTISLVAALAAIGVWIFLKNPLASVILATAIDVVGYWPSFRKSYTQPWDESLFAWVLFSVGSIFSVLALSTYTTLTLFYYVATFLANILLMGICIVRRRTLPKPIP